MTMCLRLPLLTTLIGLIPYISTEVPNQCPDPADPNSPSFFFYGHPDDCSIYFQCDHGNPIQQTCPTDLRWNSLHETCVWVNSFWDACTRENALRECDKGELGSALIPHPTACQRYYDCSKPDGFKERECNYPDVFDVNDLTCRDFRQATCGPNRVAALDACDYTISVNPPCSFCRPCHENWPSCVGFEDGLNVYTDREWTPYHVRCEFQRTVEKLFCGKHEASGHQGIFSPVRRECVSLWEWPQSEGGNQPTCDGQAAGQYRVDSELGPPHVYYSCPDGGVYYCKVGQYFKEDTQQCEDSGP